MFKKLFSDNVSLSTALSIETSIRVSGDASLSTTLSTGDASYEYEYSTTHIQLNRNRTKILLNKYFKHISKIQKIHVLFTLVSYSCMGGHSRL